MLDTVDNLKTFIAVVRAGSFSAAAKQLDTVPSVITKKINRLEDQVGAPLFHRTTRKIILTEAGERLHPRAIGIVAEVAETFADLHRSRHKMTGTLRIKCPTTLCVHHLGSIITDFQIAHPACRVDLVLLDRTVNPVEEGFDIALGALPSSYSSVTDVPLAPYPRSIVASPDYLSQAAPLTHPSQLVHHACLTFHPTGSTWSFLSKGGPVSVDVGARFSVNDSQMLVHSAARGLGVAIVTNWITRPFIADGRLVKALPGWEVPDLWVKALIPDSKYEKPLVMAMMDWLKRAVTPVAPWAA